MIQTSLPFMSLSGTRIMQVLSVAKQLVRVCVELVEIRFSSLMCAGFLSISGVLENLEVQVSFFAIELIVLRCVVQ